MLARVFFAKNANNQVYYWNQPRLITILLVVQLTNLTKLTMKKPVLIILIALLIPTFLLAQEEQKPKKYENPEWYRVVHVKFHTGKMGEATKIIKDHYRPVAEKIGINPVTYDLISGEWDRVTFFKLDGGISAYEWETSPQGIAWNNEFTKQAGGQEKADEIRKQYQSCILENKVEIVRKKVW